MQHQYKSALSFIEAGIWSGLQIEKKFEEKNIDTVGFMLFCLNKQRLDILEIEFFKSKLRTPAFLEAVIKKSATLKSPKVMRSLALFTLMCQQGTFEQTLSAFVKIADSCSGGILEVLLSNELLETTADSPEKLERVLSVLRTRMNRSRQILLDCALLGLSPKALDGVIQNWALRLSETPLQEVSYECYIFYKDLKTACKSLNKAHANVESGLVNTIAVRVFEQTAKNLTQEGKDFDWFSLLQLVGLEVFPIGYPEKEKLSQVQKMLIFATSGKYLDVFEFLRECNITWSFEQYLELWSTDVINSSFRSAAKRSLKKIPFAQVPLQYAHLVLSHIPSSIHISNEDDYRALISAFDKSAPKFKLGLLEQSAKFTIFSKLVSKHATYPALVNFVNSCIAHNLEHFIWNDISFKTYFNNQKFTVSVTTVLAHQLKQISSGDLKKWGLYEEALCAQIPWYQQQAYYSFILNEFFQSNLTDSVEYHKHKEVCLNRAKSLKGPFDAKPYLSSDAIFSFFVHNKINKNVPFDLLKHTKKYVGLTNVDPYKKGFSWRAYEDICAWAQVKPYSTRGYGQEQSVAYTLVDFFGPDSKAIINFIERGLNRKGSTSKARNKNALHDIGQTKYPTDQDCSKAEWAKFLMANPTCWKRANLFADYERKMGGVPATRQQFMDNISSLVYSGVSSKNEPFAKYCFKLGLDEDSFEDCLSTYEDVTPKTHCAVPSFETMQGVNVLKPLLPGDFRALLIGEETGCCQHINGGAADSCAIHSYESPNSCVYVMESLNSPGTAMAQSFVWVRPEEKVVVFDSIESIHRAATIVESVSRAFFALFLEMTKAGYSVYFSATSYGMTADVLKYIKKYVKIEYLKAATHKITLTATEGIGQFPEIYSVSEHLDCEYSDADECLDLSEALSEILRAQQIYDQSVYNEQAKQQS